MRIFCLQNKLIKSRNNCKNKANAGQTLIILKSKNNQQTNKQKKCRRQMSQHTEQCTHNTTKNYATNLMIVALIKPEFTPDKNAKQSKKDYHNARRKQLANNCAIRACINMQHRNKPANGDSKIFWKIETAIKNFLK